MNLMFVYLLSAVVATFFVASGIRDCVVEVAERKEFDCHIDELVAMLDSNSSEVN